MSVALVAISEGVVSDVEVIVGIFDPKPLRSMIFNFSQPVKSGGRGVPGVPPPMPLVSLKWRTTPFAKP